MTSEAVEDASGLVMFVVCRDAEHCCGRARSVCGWVVISDKDPEREGATGYMAISAKTQALPGLLSRWDLGCRRYLKTSHVSGS